MLLLSQYARNSIDYFCINAIYNSFTNYYLYVSAIPFDFTLGIQNSEQETTFQISVIKFTNLVQREDYDNAIVS